MAVDIFNAPRVAAMIASSLKLLESGDVGQLEPES
jgi:hypothetical protein